MYNTGSRRLQDQFDTRRLADRLEQVTHHTSFTEADRTFIEGSSLFFLATVDAAGFPDCSYKGGLPGFVRVLNSSHLAFPDYDGNGMFRSLGNILEHPQVALLFIDLERQRRLRVNGIASIQMNDPLLEQFPGAQLLVRLEVEGIFPNCPRYIHKMQLLEHSVYAPRLAYEPPEPDWKSSPNFNDALPARKKT